MRRAGIVILLVLLVPSLALAQSQPTSTPRDPVVAYHEVIIMPILRGRTLKDAELAAFYRTHVSIPSQVKVAEDQFVAYWKQTAERSGIGGARFFDLLASGTTYDIAYRVEEPAYNETGDQAQVKVVITITARQLLGSREVQATGTFRVTRELGAWRFVIPDNQQAEMLKLPTTRTALQFPVMRDVAAGGVRLRVATLAIEREATVLTVTFENATDNALELLDVISAATLTDETGATYQSRTLRSSLPAAVPPRQTVQGTMAFFPIPAGARKVSLTFPGVRVGDASLDLTLEMPLR
jgi:hypothetical protein